MSCRALDAMISTHAAGDTGGTSWMTQYALLRQEGQLFMPYHTTLTLLATPAALRAVAQLCRTLFRSVWRAVHGQRPRRDAQLE